MKSFLSSPSAMLLACAAAVSCSSNSTEDTGDPPAEENPFLADYTNHGKEDTGYFNPDGIEVEVDLEGDATGSSYRLFRMPAELGQFAVTYLRKRGEFYVESLAEDSGSEKQVEWLVDGVWISTQEARALPDTSVLEHFRIRGVNAVLLHDAAEGVAVGSEFTAKVPASPNTLMSDAENRCADSNSHIELDGSVYWYLWNPDRSGCDAPLQDMKLTVSKMFSEQTQRYPEYDKLTEDGKVTAVILFGQVGDGEITDDDWGVTFYNQAGRFLRNGGFEQAETAPVGSRFSKEVGDVTMEIDLYSPRDFAGLGDYAHFANLQKAISEHEVVVYRGHSMLGASDFWSQPQYPDFYQIFVYGGCLGYEYYVRPIVQGKNGWANLDLVSSVVEVSAMADVGETFLAKLAWSLDHNNAASWKDLLGAIRNEVGDSTFGASGIRDNCYSPGGSLCEPPPDPSDLERYETTSVLPIPDDDAAGVQSTLAVPSTMIAKSIRVELGITHLAPAELKIVLEHEGVQIVLWNGELEAANEIPSSLALSEFADKEVAGDWALTVVDGVAGEQGTLDGWALVVQPK